MLLAQNVGRVLIRNIPALVWEKFIELARVHDRSVEGEARQAIRAWAEPALQEADRQGRLVEGSARLRSALEAVNSVLGNRGRSKISHLAERIGELQAGHVERWFSGKIEPTFQQFERMADYFGIDPAWLKHGDRHPYFLMHERIPEDPKDGREWLLDGRYGEPEAIFFVRADNERGELAIVRQYDDWRCEVVLPPYIVSTHTGDGGFASLIALFGLWRDLYKFWTTAGVKLDIKSYLIDEKKFQELCVGDVHPLLILRVGRQCPWWEDCWDEGQYRKHQYWADWITMCETVNAELRKRTVIKTSSAS